MKRLFAALKIHPDAGFLEKYRELKHELRHEQIKWVEELNIHITLKFFGETEEQKIPVICSVLRTRSSVTLPILLKLTGLGIFGSSYAPKVIWAGLEPYAEICLLMKNIHTDLKSVGFEPDRQNLVPHLTLGRIKFLRDKIIFHRTVDHLKTISSSPIFIGEMVLYESILRREGPEYIALDKFPFIKKELP
jgi:RNA 2',3'-cyclic 3'-phosphodiesterase